MKKELEDIICAAAPKLMRDMRGDMTKTCLAFGFECGDGWFSLLLEAATELEALGTDVRAAQVKEKFGTLRLYVAGTTAENFQTIEEIIVRAERRSSLECETCGAAGSRGNGNGRRGYIQTLCDKHAEAKDQD